MTDETKKSKTLIYYLEMKSSDQLRKKPRPESIEIAESTVKDYEVNRFFYSYVGKQWNWHSKLSWTDDQWKQYAERKDLKLWIAMVKGSPAGYFELEIQPEGNVELIYFGLAPKFIGQGYGGYLLSFAVEQAWNQEGTKRVWLHTCTDDHPSALGNYQSRGFVHYKTEEDTEKNNEAQADQEVSKSGT